MSKFTVAAATSHALWITAMEEASRRGERTAGIDHLFLALTVNEQAAGQVLRSLGITVDRARRAVEAQHFEQLESLGINPPAPSPGRITFHETSGYEWAPNAIEVLNRATEGDATSDAACVLRALVGEPSGLIEAILCRLDTTPDMVLARIDAAQNQSVQHESRFDSAVASRSRECFVPAPITKVWQLLSDPLQMATWEPGIGSVDGVPESIDIGSSWIAHPPLDHPDGKPLRIKPELQTIRIELIRHEEPCLLEWRYTWPDAPSANARAVRIDLTPTVGGTQLVLATAWIRNESLRRRRLPVLSWALRPRHRYMTWIQLSQLAASISRAFR